MPHRYDVIVVGGGIYGACILRDAALRGLSALLLERHDWGSATSHNSNKIIHSGIRYLQQLDIPRVIECIQETRNWMRIAPHLVQPMPFVVPSYSNGIRSKAVMGLGVAIHDRLKRLSGCGLPLGGTLSAAETLERFPMLESSGLRGAAYWYDAQLQNANQLVQECLADALSLGAKAMNYTHVEALRLEGGAVTGVIARHLGGGESFELDSRVVVNATGPWLNDLLPEPLRKSYRFDRHYMGMNLVIDQVSAEAGLAMYGPGQGSEGGNRRLYFLTPWKNRSLVGTSHTYYEGSPERADYSMTALEDLIKAVNAAFPFLELNESRVQYVYQGLTPAAGEQESPTRSRQFSIVDHGRRDNIAGLISVMPVKLTSARFIAERVLNIVERTLGRRRTICGTAERLLPGAAKEGSKTARSAGELATCAERLMKIAEESCAQRLVDVVTCRTEVAELGMVDVGALRRCADIMANTRGWSEARKQAEYEAAKARLRL